MSAIGKNIMQQTSIELQVYNKNMTQPIRSTPIQAPLPVAPMMSVGVHQGIGGAPTTLQPQPTPPGYAEMAVLTFKNWIVRGFQQIYSIITKKTLSADICHDPNQKGYVERSVVEIKNLVILMVQKIKLHFGK